MRPMRKDLSNYIITRDAAERYAPPRHTGTTNLLYLPKGALGSQQFEVIVGMLQPGHGGEPHFHDQAEQIVFVLQGRGFSEMEGERFEIGPGTLVFHPPGQRHRELAVTEDFSILVAYSPPFGVKTAASFKKA